MVRWLPAAAVLVVASGVLTGCGGKDDSASKTPSSAPTSTTPTSAPSSPASSAPATTASPPPVAKKRTAADLKKALLARDDLPSGFSVEPEGDSGGDSTVSSKDPRCAPLVKLMNADSPPGSRASGYRSFSGGQQGPYIDEQLDAMGSVKAVAELQRSFAAAIGACRKVTVRIAGEGSSAVTVQRVSAPQAGTGAIAARFTATGGALDGLEITMVTTGIDDVVLALTFVGATGEDVDGASGDAVDKAKQILGATGGT